MSIYLQRGSFVSEPAILVKYKGKGSQVWAMDKFENKIIDMRDMYEDRKERGTLMVEDGLYSEDTPIVVRNGIVVCACLLYLHRVRNHGNLGQGTVDSV